LNLQSARLPSFHNGSPENIGGPDEGGVESVTMKLWQQKIWIWFIFGAACGVAVSAATFALITPCVRISPNVLHEFKPGMTLKEVEAIIGGPQGFYDGITGVQSNAPPWKGDWSWVGSEGEVVIYPNNAQRVEKASFYSIRILSQDKGQLVWERLTRGVLRDVNLQTPYAEMLYGAVFTLFLAIPLTVVISTWKGRFNWALGTVMIIGTCASLSFVLIAMFTMSAGELSLSGLLLGAGGTGLIVFCLGGLFGIVTRKPRRVLP
jgi:hypothetical protein